MIELPIYHVDAFVAGPFSGNPAAVVPLEGWLPDALMLAIAAQNNLSETAFFVPEPGGYGLRWFTPSVEVALCGHATLATAHVLFEERGEESDEIVFTTASGRVGVTREQDRLCLRFPRWTLAPVTDMPEALRLGLGCAPRELYEPETRDNLLAVLESERQVRDLEPDSDLLARLHPAGVIVTAPGDDVDCVCRYFAPSYGIPEDPGTGSIHCGLVPYWSARLGKREIHSRQVSRRGAEFFCAADESCTFIAGRATKYLEGVIRLAT